MTYPTSYCFTASDLYETFNKKLVKVRQDVYEKKYGVNKKQKLCASVLCYCFSLILLDIIKNNVTFVLPLFNGKEASIFVKPYTGDEFIEAKKRGAFQGIDFITTNFTGYQIVYSWTSFGIPRFKPVYISNNMKKIFYDNINAGKVYY